jgi:hypothetical protein
VRAVPAVIFARSVTLDAACARAAGRWGGGAQSIKVFEKDDDGNWHPICQSFGAVPAHPVPLSPCSLARPPACRARNLPALASAPRARVPAPSLFFPLPSLTPL